MFLTTGGIKVNAGGMDVSNDWEIYIPVEAEVKNIPLGSLPNSVLKKIGLPVPDCKTSRHPADSPTVTWICPAVVGRKSQGGASCKGNRGTENIRSLLGTDFRSRLNTMQMSFVSSNRAAWEVLKEPDRQSHQGPPAPQGSPVADDQNAVVIYLGRIYLCIRRAVLSQSRPETRGPRSASSSGSKLISDTPVKELRCDGKHKVQRAAGKVKQHALKRKDAPSVRVSHSARQPCSSEPEADSRSVKLARREQVLEEAAGLQPDSIQHHEEQRDKDNSPSTEYELQDLGEEEVDGASWKNVPVSAMETHGGDADQTGSHAWTRRESPGAATTSTSMQVECDFDELAREEEITQKMAKFKDLLSS